MGFWMMTSGTFGPQPGKHFEAPGRVSFAARASPGKMRLRGSHPPQPRLNADEAVRRHSPWPLAKIDCPRSVAGIEFANLERRSHLTKLLGKRQTPSGDLLRR